MSDQLTWGHLVELLGIDHDLERSFYEKQTILKKWTVRELKRQKDSSLFLGLAASQDKEGILQLAAKGKTSGYRPNEHVSGLFCQRVIL